MRVNAYIDGWNLYNAELNLNNNRLKWLNLRALCQHFCDENDMLNAVYYFTAYADRRNSNNPNSNNAGSNRQYSYINDFLKPFGVNTIYGYMLSSEDNKGKKKRQEKFTDVNLALQMFEDAMYDRFDKAILLSADSDFIPAIERIIKLKKEVLVLIPPELSNSKISEYAKVEYLTKEHLKTHLLPAESKNSVKIPKQYLLETPTAREQDEKGEAHFKYDYNVWSKRELCPKCKDFLEYKIYDEAKNKIAGDFWNRFIFQGLSFDGA